MCVQALLVFHINGVLGWRLLGVYYSGTGITGKKQGEAVREGRESKDRHRPQAPLTIEKYDHLHQQYVSLGNRDFDEGH